MDSFLSNLSLSIIHLQILHDVYSDESNYLSDEQPDFEIYAENLSQMKSVFDEIGAYNNLYNKDDRQMILADIIEYMLFGRGFYSMGRKRGDFENKGKFVKGILHFVNLLMCYESMTVIVDRRNIYLDKLKEIIPELGNEDCFEDLRQYNDEVGLPDSKAENRINKYFDKLLPKTAGGLWHELLVYTFLLRSDLGYVLPILLHQRIYSKSGHIVPTDFLLITTDKRVYGIEVGRKKEIQSGAFSLRTAIPTATIDTENSRSSDRCPECKKWINLCPFVIEKFSDFTFDIDRTEVKCLESCTIYSRDEIVKGGCKYSKYARNRAETYTYTHHPFSNGLHYHYTCVLDNVPSEIRSAIIAAEDSIAIKTHFPFYSGLEELAD